MIILEKYRLLETYLGLRPRSGWKTILVQSFHLVTFLAFGLSELILMILNIRDGIDKAAPAMSPFFGVIPAMGCLLHLLVIRERYYSLLEKMQEIVDESMHISNFKAWCWPLIILGMKLKENQIFYTRAEKRNTIATKIAIYVPVVVAISASSPFVLVAYYWFGGKYTIDSWFFFIPLWCVIFPNDFDFSEKDFLRYYFSIQGRHLSWIPQLLAQWWLFSTWLCVCAQCVCIARWSHYYLISWITRWPVCRTYNLPLIRSMTSPRRKIVNWPFMSGSKKQLNYMHNWIGTYFQFSK